MPEPYVLLDRDGTLIRHVHHLARIEDIEIFEDSFEAAQIFISMGFRLGVITNQSVIGRGIASERQVKSINEEIAFQMSKRGIRFEFFLFCPHLPEDECQCRKPKTGLGEIAVSQFDLDPSKSVMIGDQPTDIEFGKRMGLLTVGVRNDGLRTLDLDYYGQSLIEVANLLTATLT